MAWIYFQESAESDSHSNLGLEQSRIVNQTDMPNVFFCHECNQVTLTELPFGTTCEPCMGINLNQKSTSSSEDSHAKTSVLQEMELAWKESEADFFSKSSDLQVNFDRDSFSWKTCQLSLFGGLTEFAWNSLRWGMICDGQLFQPHQLVPTTDESDGFYLPTPTASQAGTNGKRFNKITKKWDLNAKLSLSTMATKNMWPTPRANDAEKRGDFDEKNHRNGLPAAVKRFPTPCARDFRTPSQADMNRNTPSLATISFGTGGQLNPRWVEWLMGYHIEWTELDVSATQWFRSKQEKHSKNLSESEDGYEKT